MKHIKSNILTPKVYKTSWYTPHTKYTISIYDENMELCGVFDNYKEVAEFIGITEGAVASNFCRSKNTYYYGKKYKLMRTRNGR